MGWRSYNVLTYNMGYRFIQTASDQKTLYFVRASGLFMKVQGFLVKSVWRTYNHVSRWEHYNATQYLIVNSGKNWNGMKLQGQLVRTAVKWTAKIKVIHEERKVMQLYFWNAIAISSRHPGHGISASLQLQQLVEVSH